MPGVPLGDSLQLPRLGPLGLRAACREIITCACKSVAVTAALAKAAGLVRHSAVVLCMHPCSSMCRGRVTSPALLIDHLQRSLARIGPWACLHPTGSTTLCLRTFGCIEVRCSQQALAVLPVLYLLWLPTCH